MTSAVAVPDTLDELMMPAWLDAALGRRFPGVRVREVRPGPVVARVCTNARFEVVYDERGSGLVDVGYHIAAVLTVADRRRGEADLVDHYLGRLAAAGLDPPPPEDVRIGLRRGIVLGFFLWAITLMVDPAITTVMLERLGTAAADHDALALP